MLHADPLAVEGVMGVRDVAGGEHAGRAGLQVLVDEDAVLDGDAGRGGEPAARLNADADDHEIAVQRAAVARADALDRCLALESLDAGPAQHPHAVVGVDVAVDGADLGAQHPLERDRGGLHDRDVGAALPGRGGHLAADPAGADHDHRAAGGEPLAQGVGVLDAAEVEDAVQLTPGDREAPWLAARGQQQPVVAQPLAVVERQFGRPTRPS